MSNFSFIQSTFPAIFDQIKIAEQRTFTEPISAASYIRRSLEACIHMMYDEHRLDFPYNTSLDNLIRELQYENLIPSVFGEHLKIIRKTGNAGSHFGQKVKGREVMISLQYFFGFAKWFAEMYADTLGKLPTAFDKSLVPKVGSEARKLNAIKEEMAQENDKLKAQLAKMMAEMEASQQAALASEEAMKALQEEKAQIQAKLAEKKEATIAKISSEFSTRKKSKIIFYFYISCLLLLSAQNILRLCGVAP